MQVEELNIQVTMQRSAVIIQALDHEETVEEMLILLEETLILLRETLLIHQQGELIKIKVEDEEILDLEAQQMVKEVEKLLLMNNLQ